MNYYYELHKNISHISVHGTYLLSCNRTYKMLDHYFVCAVVQWNGARSRQQRRPAAARASLG
jgi:hypothetical protein